MSAVQANITTPEVREYPERRILYVDAKPATAETFVEMVRGAIDTLFTFTDAHGINYQPRTFMGIVPNNDGTLNNELLQYRAAVIIDEDTDVPASDDVKISTLPAGREYVTIMTGGYDNMMASWGAFEEWFRSSGETFRNPSYEIYVDDMHTVSEEELKTELHIPIQ